MKLNYEILRTELEINLGIGVKGVNNNCGPVESPFLFDKGMQTKSAHCYITDSLPRRESGRDEKTLFIVCDNLTAESLKNFRDSIIYFSSPQSLSAIMNLLMEIFEKYSRWDRDLLESLHKTGALEDLLRLSVPIFNNPIYFIDSGFFVLASAAPDRSPVFEKPQQMVDDIWIIRGKEDLVRARDNDEKPYFRHLPNDFPRLFINLTEGDYLLGNLSVQGSHREFFEFDGYLLTHLAEVVRIALLRYGTTDNKMRSLVEHMMSVIISGGTVDEEEFLKVISSFRVTPGEEFRCLAVRTPQPSGREYIRNFLRNLGTQVPAIYVSTIDDVAAMVLSTTRAERQGIDVISILEDKLKSFGFKVGLSDKYENLLYSQRYFIQARFALEKAEIDQKTQNVSLFSDYCLDYILENCSGKLKQKMLWKEGFTRLLEHDANGRADYVNTLRSFLNNNLNAQRTAAELHITRNSLLSQLERINTLLDEDLRDPKIRFRYELTLLLYDKFTNVE